MPFDSLPIRGIVYVFATNGWGNICGERPTRTRMRSLAVDRELRGVLVGEIQ
jgi:hypothetical protein